MVDSDDIQLVKIDSDQKWLAYKRLFEEENRRRGIEGKPLPDKQPQRSASVELDLTIQRFFELWERDKPLQQVKEALALTSEQVREDTGYYYQQARFCLENSFSGVVGIVEDALGLSNAKQVQYFVEPEDFFTQEEVAASTGKNVADALEFKEDSVEPVEGSLQKSVRQRFQATSNFVSSIAQKGIEDIGSVEQAVCGFLSRFKGR